MLLIMHCKKNFNADFFLRKYQFNKIQLNVHIILIVK